MDEILRIVNRSKRINSIEYSRERMKWTVVVDDLNDFQCSTEELEYALTHLDEYLEQE